MNPEDCVLVGVVNRKRDLQHVLDRHWYRIPKGQMPRGFYADYVAFYLSGSAIRPQASGIYYYATVNGHELAYRRDLLPDEAEHPRANQVYYRISLDDLQEKLPPVVNPTNRIFAFIYTTWDRFVHAEEISELYSSADHYVDRIYYALRRTGVYSQRLWDGEKGVTGLAAGLQILCEQGLVTVSAGGHQDVLYLDTSQPEDKIMKAIRAEIGRQGGPVTINIPMEGL